MLLSAESALRMLNKTICLQSAIDQQWGYEVPGLVPHFFSTEIKSMPCTYLALRWSMKMSMMVPVTTRVSASNDKFVRGKDEKQHTCVSSSLESTKGLSLCTKITSLMLTWRNRSLWKICWGAWELPDTPVLWHSGAAYSVCIKPTRQSIYLE